MNNCKSIHPKGYCLLESKTCLFYVLQHQYPSLIHQQQFLPDLPMKVVPSDQEYRRNDKETPKSFKKCNGSVQDS